MVSVSTNTSTIFQHHLYIYIMKHNLFRILPLLFFTYYVHPACIQYTGDYAAHYYHCHNKKSKPHVVTTRTIHSTSKCHTIYRYNKRIIRKCPYNKKRYNYNVGETISPTAIWIMPKVIVITRLITIILAISPVRLGLSIISCLSI